MTAADTIIVYLIAVTLILNISLVAGLLLNSFRNRKARGIKAELQTISVLVSLKNESSNVKNLINSLKNVSYPNEKVEYILLNDASDDNTLELLKLHTEGDGRFIVFDVREKELNGKRGALQEGIKLARFPYIVITDADCTHPESWLYNFSNYFSAGFEVVVGPAPYIKTSGLVNHIACFTNLRNFLLKYSMAGLGLPYSATARNLGYKKELLLKTGGYASTADSPSGDDDLLMREFNKIRARIAYADDRNFAVFSKTKEKLGAYILQKSRHTASSFHYSLSSKITLWIWHFYNILAQFGFLFMVFDVRIAYLTVVKIFFDIFVVLLFQKQFAYNFRIPAILSGQFLYELFIEINFFNSLTGKSDWKK